MAAVAAVVVAMMVPATVAAAMVVLLGPLGASEMLPALMVAAALAARSIHSRPCEAAHDDVWLPALPFHLR